MGVRACVCACLCVRVYVCIAQPIEVTVGAQILIFYARPYKMWSFIIYVIGKSLKLDFPREYPYVGWIFTWLFDVKGAVKEIDAICIHLHDIYSPYKGMNARNHSGR